MTIAKNKPNFLKHTGLPFTTLLNHTIQNIHNPNAMAMYTYLASKPEDWKICKQHLANFFGKGCGFIRSGWNYLKSLGLLRVEAIRDSRGRIVRWETHLSNILPSLYEQQKVSLPQYPADVQKAFALIEKFLIEQEEKESEMEKTRSTKLELPEEFPVHESEIGNISINIISENRHISPKLVFSEIDTCALKSTPETKNKLETNETLNITKCNEISPHANQLNDVIYPECQNRTIWTNDQYTNKRDIQIKEKTNNTVDFKKSPDMVMCSPDKINSYAKNYKEDSLFMTFYNMYPNKQKPARAHRAFKKLNPTPDFVKMLVRDVQLRTANNWHGRDKSKIPHPATYLNDHEWAGDLYKPAKSCNAHSHRWDIKSVYEA